MGKGVTEGHTLPPDPVFSPNQPKSILFELRYTLCVDIDIHTAILASVIFLIHLS